MSALADKPRKQSSVDSAITPCHLLTRQGEQCRKPGQVGLPSGVCPEHAVAIYRAVAQLIAERSAA